MRDIYIEGDINITYERYVFNRRVQQEDERFEYFLANI